MKMVEMREELRWQLARFKSAEEWEATHPDAAFMHPFWGQPFSADIDETPVPPGFREVVVEPFDGTQDPHAHLQAYQTQMYISGGSDQLNCKLFPGALRGVAMQWMATLPPRSIQTFGQLAGSFISQFAANKAKKLEVADLFDLKQGREESLKSYLARFNNSTVRVDNPDQKFFVKAFQKGLRAGPFCDALALRKPSNMDEIHALEPDRNANDRATLLRDNVVGNAAKGLKRPAPSRHADDSKRHARPLSQSFTPLKEKRAQIMHEICHTSLLDFPRDVRGRSMV
ncbi:hypothetical protein CR513_55474, partial [Mucuna pruriens]